MSRIVVIGEDLRVQGWALAGATPMPAGDADSVHRAWRSLGADVAIVILTSTAAAHLAEVAATDWPLVVVLP